MKELTGLGIRTRGATLELLDQQRIPQEERWLDIRTTQDMIDAIVALQVRGAPLIGVAAALSLAHEIELGCGQESWLQQARAMRRARPTAVNLAWAVDRLVALADPWSPETIVAEAEAIFEEDVGLCVRMGEAGAALLQDGDRVLTHCNTGGLATAGLGTALGVIATAHQQGKSIHVYADETRPLLQGGRLTTWELARLGIPHTLICDSAAAQCMQQGQIDKIIVGADRIARNGDAANKVGTYSLAVNAAYHRIPFYIAAPCTTVDLNTATGQDIPIELRDPEEVLGASGGFGETRWAPENTHAENPAFDTTPNHLISGWILDRGVVTDPTLLAGVCEAEDQGPA